MSLENWKTTHYCLFFSYKYMVEKNLDRKFEKNGCNQSYKYKLQILVLKTTIQKILNNLNWAIFLTQIFHLVKWWHFGLIGISKSFKKCSI